MKNLLLIVGIVLVVACIIALLFAVVNMMSYHSLRDGTAAHYQRLHQKMIIYYIVGAVLLLLAVICFVIRFKI